MKEKFFIDAKVQKIDKKIKTAIKKCGISYPHHSLAFFKATYAKFEDENLNGVILADSVKEDVKYLIGTQVNQNHLREGYIMGSIIDAYVNKQDEIEIVFTFAKTVYEEQYNEALELMSQNKLTVSFELMVSKENVEHLAGGVKRLTKVDFDGVGLLFGVKPAYPNAYVLETAMKIIEKAFNQDDKQLVYASAKDITQKWVKIGSLIEKAINEKENILEHNKTEGESIMDKKAQDALLAKQKEFIVEEFGEEAVKDWSDEDFLNQDKIDALRDSLKAEESEVIESDEEKTEDEIVEEPKVEEVVEEVVEEPVEEVVEEPVEEVVEEPVEEVVEEPVEEPKVEEAEVEEPKSEETAEKFTQVVEEKIKTEMVYDTEANTETTKTEAERTVESDGKKVVEEKVIKEVTYTYAEFEALKAELTDEIDKLKTEVSFLKENAKTIVEVRAELGRFVEELSDEELFDETKIEIARLKKENQELKNAQSKTTNSENEQFTAKLDAENVSKEAKIKYMKKRTRQI